MSPVKAPDSFSWQSWAPIANAPWTEEAARAIRLAGGQTKTSQGGDPRPRLRASSSPRSAESPFIFQFPATNWRKSILRQVFLAASPALLALKSPPPYHSPPFSQNARTLYMIQWLGRLSRSVIAQVLMGFLALSFGVWGIADVFTGQASSTAVATVGSTEISSQDFTRDYRNLLRAQSQQSEIQLTAEMAQRMGLGPSELQQIISRTALDNMAARLGLTTPDAELAQEVRAMPSFKGASGNFDHTLFLQIVSNAGYSEQSFLESIRGDNIRQQLSASIEGGFRLPTGYAQAIFLYATQTRAADYVIVSPDSLGPIAPPTDAA